MKLELSNVTNVTPDRAVNTAIVEGTLNGQKVLVQITPLKVITERQGQQKMRNGEPQRDNRGKVLTYSGDQIMSLGANSVRLDTSLGTVQYGAYANLVSTLAVSNGSPFDISSLLK